MPYALEKGPGKNKYWVITTKTGVRHSKRPLSEKKANAQLRVLQNVMHGGDLGEKIRDAFDPNKNGLNASIQQTGEVLGKTFDPDKNGLADAVRSAVEAVKNVDWNQVKQSVGDALDPKKNGVDAAFAKFGGDARKAFEDLGAKIKESAERDKAKLDNGFAALRNEFTNPDSALTHFVRSAGIPLTPDEWKHKFEDPETYFTIMSLMVTAAASVVSAGMAGPGTFAAMQAIIASARVITKAAQGHEIGPGDIAGVVLASIPGKGATDPSSWLQVATTTGSVVGKNLVKKAAKNVITHEVKDRLAEMGETLATISHAAEIPEQTAESLVDKQNRTEAETFQAQATAKRTREEEDYKLQHNGKTPEEVKADEAKALYERTKDVKPPSTPEEQKSFSDWLDSKMMSHNNLNFTYDNYRLWRESLLPPPPPPPPAAIVGHEPIPYIELENLDQPPVTMVELDSFYAFIASDPEFAPEKNVSIPVMLQKWRTYYNSYLTSLYGGSKLIHHVYNHHIHKRPRMSYDPRFFA